MSTNHKKLMQDALGSSTGMFRWRLIIEEHGPKPQIFSIKDIHKIKYLEAISFTVECKLSKKR